VRGEKLCRNSALNIRKKCKSKYNEITEFTNITNDNQYTFIVSFDKEFV